MKPNVLVKIDVQGYEDRVLLGGERVIRAASHVLVETLFESLYEVQASFDVTYGIMKKYGFQYAGNVSEIRSPMDGRSLAADVLFVRNK